MSQFVVVAHITANPDRAAVMATEIGVLAEATRLETGCQCYQVCRDDEVFGTWLIYEIWESKSHWMAHLETPHLQYFKTEILPKYGSLTVDKLAFVT
ncbi:MAG: antibiotic biosynthesis monooxygenase [Cohaesibacter sp.]|nr:antibiotic biosynthesis monooxygenase [Cohaesibacter sp.]